MSEMLKMALVLPFTQDGLETVRSWGTARRKVVACFNVEFRQYDVYWRTDLSVDALLIPAHTLSKGYFISLRQSQAAAIVQDCGSQENSGAHHNSYLQ